MSSITANYIHGKKGWSFDTPQGLKRLQGHDVKLINYSALRETTIIATILSDQARLDYLNDVYLIYVFEPGPNSRRGLMFFNRDGEIYNNSTMALASCDLQQRLETDPVMTIGHGFFAGDRFTGGNMAHVGLDHCRRAAVAIANDICKTDELYFYDTSWPWAKSLIRHLFGEVNYLKNGEIYHFSKLWMFSNISALHIGIPSVQHCHYYAQLLLDLRHKIAANDSPSRKLYINRRSAKSRSIINEQDIIDHLSNAGFESIDLAEYSFLEQISIFNAATEIIAPHGAGLTNLFACQAGTRVTEFYVGNRGVTTYEKLSQVFDLSYQRHDFELHNGILDLERFKETLR